MEPIDEMVEVEILAISARCSTYAMSELNYGASSADDCEDKNDQCNHKKNMDIRAEYVEADESEQPQDQKNYKDGPQHSFVSLRSQVPVISCA
jgi:hypothetical protein